MKKLLSYLLALALTLSLAGLAAAAEETWITEDFTMEVPDGMYQLTPTLADEDPLWALAGVADASAKKEDYQDMGVLVNFVSEDGKTSISVMQRENEYTQNVYNLALLNQEERDKVLGDLGESNNEELTVTKTWYQTGELPIYRVQLDMAGANPMHELLFGTVINGYALNIDIFNGENEITPEQEAILERLVGSLKFSRISEKPAPDTQEATNLLLMLILLLLAITIPLIYIPVRNRRDKKQKAKLAEQLSEYHRTHGMDEAEGEPMFINDTDCTNEAIHAFSFFQAYIKNVGELVFGGVMCMVMVATAFLIDSEWWMKLIAAGIAVYYVYKIIAMPSAVEKVQRKVYGRGISQTAHYTFYPEAFRVSGIQSASVIPYFQITDLRRRGQYVYLYYGPDNAYMVDQYGFTQGEFEDFVKFIQEKTKK